MKQTIVSITCDNCGQHVVAGHEQTVILSVNGKPYESDWCTECHEALVAKLSSVANGLTCGCGFTAKSERGLATHQRRMGH